MGYHLQCYVTFIGLLCSIMLTSGFISHDPVMQELEEKPTGYDAADHVQVVVKTASPTNEKAPENTVTSDEKDLSATGKSHREREYTDHVFNPTTPHADVASHDVRVNDVTLTGVKNEMTESSNREVLDDNYPDTMLTEEEQDKKNCSTCGKQNLEEEAVKKMRLSMFVEMLRQRLHLPESSEEEESSTEKAPRLPSDLLQKIFQNEAANEEQEELYDIDDEILIPGEGVDAMCSDLGMTGCYKFDLKDKITHDIAAASLWFNRSHDTTRRLSSQHLKVYEIEVLSGVTNRKLIHVGRNDLVNKNGWVSLNLTKFVKSWVEEGAESKVLAIKCDYSVLGNSEGEEENKFNYTSALEIKYAKAKTGQRKKKNANSDPCNPRTECCKHPLVVNFLDVGLNVFQPRTLKIDYCYGSCDAATNNFFYNHTNSKQLYRLGVRDNTTRQILTPCCGPIALQDISLLFPVNGNFVRKIMRNLVVEKCGCL